MTPIERLAIIAKRQHDFYASTKGDGYRELSDERLLRGLRQSVDELEIALKYDTDVQDKAADVANYAAYLSENNLDRFVASVAFKPGEVE